MSDAVLVTGATGLIGRYVVDQLLSTGHSVRVLVRNPGRLDPATIGRVSIVAGDVRDRRAVSSAVRGAHTVLHLAGYARAWARDPVEFAEVNVRAVQYLLDAAQEYGVERLVHVSTVLTLAGIRPDPGHGGRDLTPYEESKFIGEQLVDGFAAAGHRAVVVHPSRVYGPGPLNDANGVTRLMALYLAGPLVPRLADGDVLGNYVHVADVARGVILAAERGSTGAHYVLGGENISMRRLLDLIGEVSGVHRRVLPVPRSAALVAAHAAQLWGRCGGVVAITPAWVRTYLDDHAVDVARSSRELGYRFRSLRQGLEETITWLRQPLPAAS